MDNIDSLAPPTSSIGFNMLTDLKLVRNTY